MPPFGGALTQNSRRVAAAPLSAQSPQSTGSEWAPQTTQTTVSSSARSTWKALSASQQASSNWRNSSGVSKSSMPKVNTYSAAESSEKKRNLGVVFCGVTRYDLPMFTVWEITDEGEPVEHFTGTGPEAERALVALHRSGRWGIVRQADDPDPFAGTVVEAL